MAIPRKTAKADFKREEPLTVRPGEKLKPVDFEDIKKQFKESHDLTLTEQDAIAYALYPKVFSEFVQTAESYGDISVLDTPTFFYGMRLGEEIEVEIEKEKPLLSNSYQLANRIQMPQEFFTLS